MKTLFRTFAVMLFLLLSCRAFAVCDVAATSINFGNYDVFSTAPDESTGTITVTCTDRPPGVFVNIAIGASMNSGTFNPRQMKRAGGTDLLHYNIFTTAAAANIWGDGTSGTYTVTTAQRVRRNRPGVLTVYGRIPAGQNVSVGTYSDTVVVTINY